MMEEQSDTLVSSFKDHFTRTWEMWKEMIGNIPDDEWTKGDIDYLIPARHLCHVLVTADFYTGDTPVDQYDWSELFGGNWEEMSPEELPSKEAVLAKLDDIRATVEGRLTKLSDAALLESEKVCPWAGKTRMAKLLDLLRHTQHHAGEVSAELRRRNIEGASWK